MNKYRKLKSKTIIENWWVVHLCELNQDNYEIRAVEIFSDNSYGYAYGKKEYNGTSLSDCAFPTVNEFYTSGEFDLNESDYYEITKEEFEKELKIAIEYCNIHNIIPRTLD
jgi:hypothetical protein